MMKGFLQRAFSHVILGSIVMLTLLSITTANAATLDALQWKQEGDKTIIYCTLTGRFKHKAFMLSQPSRVVIDFDGVRISSHVAQMQVKQGIINRFRHGMPNTTTLRLVFDITQSASLYSSPWVGSGGMVKGIQIIIKPTTKSRLASTVTPIKNTRSLTVAKATPTPTLTHYPSLAQHKMPIRVKHEPPRSLRDVVVVIDPGHGGKDPGAIGLKRTQEKQVVLAIALKLKQLIDRQPGMRAVLTRNGDYYIGLRERLNIARRNNADIFVAIHADAYANHQSSGASVFALSQRGATSEAARWIAEKENYSELGGVNLSDLDDRSGVIRTVLLDLSQTATISASLQMGGKVLRQLDTMTNLHNNKVEQARFVVLKSPDIPSVLIETGFISNLREEQNLNNAVYQMKLSHAIFDGIKQYFWAYPPHGSRIEAMTGINRKLARM